MKTKSKTSKEKELILQEEQGVGNVEEPEVVEEELPFQDMAFHFMVTGCMARGLTEEESIEWATLFKTGEKIREKNREEKVINDERKRFLAYGGEYKGVKKGVRNGSYVMSLDSPSLEVMRWFLARNSGLSPAQASEASGAKWNQVINECQRNEELRCVRDGVFSNLKQLTREMSYGVAIDVLNGDAIPKDRLELAKWTLERVDAHGSFKNPKAAAIEESKNQAAKTSTGSGGGGIVINLIGDAVDKISSHAAKLEGKAKIFTDI